MKKIIEKIKNWYQGKETELFAVERDKYVDIYARYEKSMSARIATAIVNYWRSHWQWTLTFIVAVIACIFAFPPFYEFTHKQAPTAKPRSPQQNNKENDFASYKPVDIPQRKTPPIHKLPIVVPEKSFKPHTSSQITKTEPQTIINAPGGNVFNGTNHGTINQTINNKMPDVIDGGRF